MTDLHSEIGCKITNIKQNITNSRTHQKTAVDLRHQAGSVKNYKKNIKFEKNKATKRNIEKDKSKFRK